MNLPEPDPVLVPLSANVPPYAIDPTTNGDHYIRIRRAGPDLLVLVPPGADAPDLRDQLITEMKARAVEKIGPFRRSRSRHTAAFCLIVAALLAAGSAAAVTGLYRSTEVVIALLALIVVAAAAVAYTAPKAISLLGAGGCAVYPRDPQTLLDDLPPEARIRFLTEDDLRGDGSIAMTAMHKDVLESPSTILPAEWAVLWHLAARDELYASSLVTVNRLAEFRLDESLQDNHREFAVEMQLSLDDLERIPAKLPPTSPGEDSDTKEAA